MENIILESAPNEGNARQRFKGYSVAELNGQTVYDRGYKCTLHPSLSLQCDSQKLTENMDSVRTLRKSSISCAQMCTVCSLSVSLSCSLPHTHSITHTTRFSQNTHGGERLVAGNVKLLCHVQSKSGSLTSCVCNAGMCVCSAHPMSRLAALSVWVLS